MAEKWMKECPYTPARRLPSRLKWAEAGPIEHPERTDVRYFNMHDPVSSVSEPVSESIDTISSRLSQTPARRILKPLKTESFEWRRRSRLKADSFSDEPIDWDLATMEYEPQVFISKEDSVAALQRKKEEKKRRKRSSSKERYVQFSVDSNNSTLSERSIKNLIRKLRCHNDVVKELKRGIL